LRRVNVSIVAVEKAVLHIMSVYVSSLCYTACKAHAPYYIVICLYHIFFFTLSH